MKKVRMALIGSGSGSTGAAAIDAFQSGDIPSVSEIVAFISTVPGAGLLQKAEERGIFSYVCDDSEGREFFQQYVRNFVKKNEINLLVSAGCRAMLPDLKICVVNTHPQCTRLHGGRNMVGLEPHLHFLEHEVIDLLYRGRANVDSRFFARITFHYVSGNKGIESVTDFDSGEVIQAQPVLIPKELIEKAWALRMPCRSKDGVWDWTREQGRKMGVLHLAHEIQDYVLIHERQAVPKFIERIAWELALA